MITDPHDANYALGTNGEILTAVRLLPKGTNRLAPSLAEINQGTIIGYAAPPFGARQLSTDEKADDQ